jgi:hypothetical protein
MKAVIIDTHLCGAGLERHFSALTVRTDPAFACDAVTENV